MVAYVVLDENMLPQRWHDPGVAGDFGKRARWTNAGN